MSRQCLNKGDYSHLIRLGNLRLQTQSAERSNQFICARMLEAQVLKHARTC
jgi:hypothetical protein